MLLCLLSAVAVLTSMLGPLLVRAVQQSTLTDALDAAGLAGTSVSVSGDADSGEPYDQGRVPALAALQAGLDVAPASLWQQPQILITSKTNVFWKPAPGQTGLDARVSALDDGCELYVLTAGTCATEVGQVMVSAADAARLKVVVGATVSFTLAQAPETAVKVVGLYAAGASPAAGLVRPGTGDGVLAGVASDPLVMVTQQTADLPIPMSITARMTLVPGLTVTDAPVARSSVETVRAAVSAQDRLLALQTTLPDVLARVDAQARSAQVLILVTTVQAVGLAIFALAIVLQRVGRARAAEWSVGRLRGVPRRRWLSSVYVEPVVALLLGLPIGFLAGVAVARLAISLTLRPGTPLELWRWPVLAAAAAATVIALGALVAVSLRSVRRPLAELVQQESEGRQLTPLGAVAQSAVLLLAAATVYQLVTGGVLSTSGPQLGLLAPGLFALAVAMLAVRAAVVGVRRVTTRPPRSLAALVVGRHAARTPSSLNPAMVIAVGVALAVFATQVFAVSVRNQGLRADAVTGAATVLQVSVPDDVDLIDAVNRADPGGTQAMAVQETAVGELSGKSRIVAVDSARLAAVSSWSTSWAGVGDLGAGDLETALRGDTTEPIVLHGTQVRVDLRTVRVQPQPLPNPGAVGAVYPPPPPRLVLTLVKDDAWQTVSLGALQKEASTQRFRADLPCDGGCRLVSLGLQAAANQPYKASFTVTALATDEQPASESATSLQGEGHWRAQSKNNTLPEPTAMATPTATATGLGVEAYDTEGGTTTSVSPTDTVDPLPAVIGPRTFVEPVPGDVGTAYGAGLDGQDQRLQVLGQASILPRVLDDGVLVDLTNARGLTDPSTAQTIDEVWLGPGAPVSVEEQLTAQGVQIQSRDVLDTTRDELLGQATTRGAAVALVVGAAALALTLLALVAARWADAGRRGDDWRALREGGVSRRRLKHLVRVEIAVPSFLGVLVGMLSGALAARIAAGRLPLVDASQPGPPLDLHLAWTPILLIALGTAAVIAVIAQTGAVVETRPRENR